MGRYLSGVIGMDHLDKVSSEAIDSMLGTNVKGAIFTIQAVVPGMKARGSGHIITVSSISAKEVYPVWTCLGIVTTFLAHLTYHSLFQSSRAGPCTQVLSTF